MNRVSSSALPAWIRGRRSRRPPALVVLVYAATACADLTTFSADLEPISITVEADTVVSDGTSSTLVQAVLPPSLPQDANVDFSTSLGRFVNPAAGAPERKVSVRAQNGRAQARLIPGGETGTAHVSAAGAGSVAQTTVTLVPPALDAVDLFVDRVAVPADGATPVVVSAVVRRIGGALARGALVRFEARDSTTRELLPELGGLAVADSGGTARLRLTTTRIGTVELRAYAGPVQSEVRWVRYTPPPPPATSG